MQPSKLVRKSIIRHDGFSCGLRIARISTAKLVMTAPELGHQFIRCLKLQRYLDEDHLILLWTPAGPDEPDSAPTADGYNRPAHPVSPKRFDPG